MERCFLLFCHLNHVDNSYWKYLLDIAQLTSSSSFPFPTLSWVGTTCFSSYYDKDSAIFLRPAACLTSTLLENGVGANDCKCSRDQLLDVRSTEELEIINFGLFYAWPLRTLLSFRDRTPSALTAGPSSSSTAQLTSSTSSYPFPH
jgi:hypothetical protein